jgi:Nitrile hydratase, alpha chain
MGDLGTLRAIVAKAAKDDSFRDGLLRDARATIEAEFGVALPEDTMIHVHENSSTDVHLVLPARIELSEARRLSQEELERVAGGHGIAPRFATLPCTSTHCFAWDAPGEGRP